MPTIAIEKYRLVSCILSVAFASAMIILLPIVFVGPSLANRAYEHAKGGLDIAFTSWMSDRLITVGLLVTFTLLFVWQLRFLLDNRPGILVCDRGFYKWALCLRVEFFP